MAAEQALAAALALAPDNPDVVRCLALAARRRGDLAMVVDCCRKLVAAFPDDASLHMELGAALFAAGEIEDGIGHLRRACTLAPGSAAAWLNLGEALKQAAQGRSAIAALEQAARLDAKSVPVRLALARACASMGDTAEARRAFRDAIEREPDNPGAWFGLSNLSVRHFDSEDVRRLQQGFAGAASGTRAQELLGFALAKALEDRGDHAAAFDTLVRVNAPRRARFKWDAASERRHAQAIQRTFAAWQPPEPDARDAGREIIFIASIPRSGSSLVEQILASHHEVDGANEIQDLPDIVDRESARRRVAFPEWVSAASADDWSRLGAEYLRRTARWRARKPRCTDKNLANWYLAGAALAMLPAARVVVVRRDPLETCLGCFRQRLGGDAGFTCDLDDMADYCVDFLRLTRCWLQRFPQRVFDLEYETLVADPERGVRDLLAFCGLPFERACMEFRRTDRSVLSAPSATQVRQPLRRDTARAHLYGDKLDRLRARLAQAGVRGNLADAPSIAPPHRATLA